MKEAANSMENKISYTISDGLPKKIYSDLSRLRQILFNLFSNAIKFTRNGLIKVSAEEIIDEG